MVTNILGKQSLQMAFIQRNNVVQQVLSAAFDPTLRDAILPGRSEGSSLGNHPRGFHRCDHLEPELLIAIKDQVFVRRFKGKCLAQLLDDPTASRMLRDVNVQDAPPIMADDEEAVEYAEGNRWHSKEIHGCDGFPMVSKKGQPALGPVGISRCSFHPTRDASLGRSKPSMRSSPWIRGTPQVGFSATIPEINSLTSFGVGLLPTCFRTLEISRQYIRKPVRCRRTTVSGVTRRERIVPSRPDAPSDYPEKLIEPAEDRARMSTFQRDELLTQDKILEKETSPPAKEAAQHAKAEPNEAKHGHDS